MTKETQENHQPKWQFRFFTIWFGQSFSMLGSHLVGFAFVWYLTEQTGSATVLTLGTLMQVLPSVVISPFAGALVDRWNRKLVMAVFDSITALFTLFVAMMFVFDNVQIWHIMLAMFIRSACGQFQWAAMTASTALMVPKQHLSRVAGANQTLQGIMSIIGPALGAFLIAALPMEGILFIDVSTAVLAVAPLFFLSIPQPVRNGTKATPNKPEKTSVFQDIAEGWKYVYSWPGLSALFLLVMLVKFLIIPAFSLLPLVVTEHFGKGALELGFINSALGIGIILGGLTLSAWGGFKNRILTSLSALTISGGAFMVVGFAPANGYIMGLAGMALFGFIIPMLDGPLIAVIQAKVDPEIQGRVFSLLHAGGSLATPLGLAIAGPVADATSNQLLFVVGGILTLVAGLASFFIRDIRNIGAGIDEDEIIPPEGEEEAAHPELENASL